MCHATVLFTPWIVGMIANSDLIADYGDSGSPADQDFSLPELVDDLFRCAPLSDHLFPLLRYYIWYHFRGLGHGSASLCLLV